MVRHPREEAQKALRAVVILLRNTTWKCGRVERLIVNYLRRKFQRYGYAQSSVREMLQHFELNSKQKSEFLNAIRRLERRRIVKLNQL